MALLERKIDIVLAYGTGDNGDGPPVNVTLSGHRVSVNTVSAGGAGMPTAQVRVFGLTLSMMNQLSTVGQLPNAYRANKMTILAGDTVNGMAKIFEGTILTAWADMQAAPDVAFNITAFSGGIEALRPVPPSSYPGTADAAVILANLADQMGVPFENNGVSVILTTPYYPGTARDQAVQVVDHAGIEWNAMENGVLAIWPRGGARGGSVPLISPETGLQGYPTYTATGIVLTSLFNPVLRHGGQVQVKSALTPACGTWNIVTLVHDIESQVPSGKWATQIQVAKPGYAPVA